tara:strand:+ start:31 stop:291 length:261 start_codon:yes stop_codon:yes gene_type:complete
MKSSAANYRKNPASYKKKLAYDKKNNAKPAQKAKRRELGKARYKAKKLGLALTGKDMSHTKSGKMVPENSSTNRARNGHGKNGRLK